MPKKVLIVEDNPDISKIVALNVREMGFACDATPDGTEGLKKALSGKYDLIILDVILPGINGLDICKKLRLEKIDSAILMLTSKSEEVDKVLGLELGADDYLTKPFGVRELAARMKAIIRRLDKGPKPEPGDNRELIHFGHLIIDRDKHRVLRKGKPVELTAKEFDLLHLFVTHPGRCFSRQQLLETIWGYDYSGYDHTINTHINRLRSKIEEDPGNPKYIRTLRGVGYKIGEPEEFE